MTSTLVALTARCRREGMTVGTGQLLAAHEALLHVDPSATSQVRAALQAVLCSCPGDLRAFRAAFDAVLGTAPAAVDEAPDEAAEVPGSGLPAAPEAGAGQADGVLSAWSELERLRDKDFGTYTEADRAALRAMLARMAVSPPARPSRRLRRSRSRADRLDLRATLRAAARHAGDPVELRRARRTLWPRRLVVVADVSGSMEPYSRAMLLYLQAASASPRPFEAFIFATRVTRVTRELTGTDPEAALRRAAAAATDWGGGTRIGDALSVLNRTHGAQLGRSSEIVIISDGWDRGDPVHLAAEVARLRRQARRLIWVNPYQGVPGFEPLVRGLAAALPYADHAVAGNTLRSLEDLGTLLAS